MNRFNFSTFVQLFKKDMLSFRREYGGKFVDTLMLFLTNVLVFSYFMPEMGLNSEYGPFLLIGAIASFGLFEVVGKVGTFIADLEGDRTISYTLTLPVRSEAVFCYTGIFWALTSILLCLPLFPIGKLLLWSRFDLKTINYWQLIPIFLTSNIFFGFFSLWLTSVIKGTTNLGSIFMRFINPLFMFGAYFYSWQSTFQLSSTIGYLSLLNPMVYVMEGTRAAALGQAHFIPVWICFLVLWAFIFLFGYLATRRLKKRLDCL